MKGLFGPLSAETLQLMRSVPALINKSFPLPGRFRSGLAADVAELSRLQTSSRGERCLSYLSRPNHLSAYLRYFFPWNIFRLCKLLPNLDISLSPGDAIVDLGCGPMTLAAALWISRPELRKIPLELRCIDHTAPVLEAGKKIFQAISGPACSWKITGIRGSIGADGTISFGTGKRQGSVVRGNPHTGAVRGKPAALVCAVNVFNEIYKKVSPNDRNGLKNAAAHSAKLLESCAADIASVLVVEPGLPFAGEFISCLRDELVKKKRFPFAPCPHCNACPMPGGGSGPGKKRWCHFAFDTTEAPADLQRLSAAAGIPKDRAVLSFLFSGWQQTVSRNQQPRPEGRDIKPLITNKSADKDRAAHQNLHHTKPGKDLSVRIISDAFPLPERKYGRYGCSEQGLILAVGRKAAVEACASGSLIKMAVNPNEERDPKSGALVLSVEL